MQLWRGSPDSVEILVVDDREKNLMALEAVLDSPDFTIIKASSGEHALRYLLDNKPALILLDVQMPGLDGYETASIIKASERTRDIPIIFMTALHNDEQFLRKGYQHGAVDYLSKPFDGHILKSKVDVFVELHRKNLQLLKVERDLRDSERIERERKLAELELKALKREQNQQKRYQDLVQGIHHGIVWAADPETLEFTYVGPTAERILGFDSADWTAAAGFWLSHLHEEDLLRFTEAIREAVGPTGSAELEHRFWTASHRIVWLRTGLRKTFHPESGCVELHGLSVDITKLKETEASLERSRKRSDYLAQIGLLLASSFDVDTALTQAGQLLVPHLFDHFRIDVQREDWVNVCDLTIRSPKVEINHSDLVEALGSSQPISKNGGVMCPILHRGVALGVLTLGSMGRDSTPSDLNFARDLATRFGAAIENSRLYKASQSAINIRDEFLSIASHELKTPLTPLKLQIQQIQRALLQKRELPAERVHKMLTTADRQITKLSKLIEDLLDISRISRGQLELECEEFNLCDLIEDIVGRFARQLEEAGCFLHWNAKEEVLVHWDPFRIEQVLVNLLTNAIKYAPGKPIAIEVVRSGDSVSIVMKDEGPGIANEDQNRIFERFERADSKSSSSGLGLGLYIVSQILELHRGRICVESEPNRGARFTVTIPHRLAPVDTAPDL